MSIVPPARNPPARASMLNLWLAHLRAQLTVVEARVAQLDLRPAEHLAATATAYHITRQIEQFQAQLAALTRRTHDEPPEAGEAFRRF